MQTNRLKNIIESLLFVAGSPLKLAELANLAQVPEDAVRSVLAQLEAQFADCGINLIKLAHGYQLVTNPENGEYVSRLLDAPLETYLTGPSLETLAIVAYKQPVTRAEIDQIRGVASDSSLDTLIRRRLIEEKGRADGLGRPVLFGTTEEFLKHFGLQDLSSLPPLPESETIDEMIRRGETPLPAETEGDHESTTV